MSSDTTKEKDVKKQENYSRNSNGTFKCGVAHPQWKGNKVGYSGIHKWISRKYGNPKICENCDTKNAKKYDWANISGDYKRDRNDWQRLCRLCHNRLDGITEDGRKKISEFHSKPVSCYYGGVFMRTYSSMAQAGYYLGIDHSGISKVVRGVRKTCGGYSFKYLYE